MSKPVSGRTTPRGISPRSETPRGVSPRSTTPRAKAEKEKASVEADIERAARPAVLESRGTTSEEVFQRILRKLQREENFNAIAAERAAKLNAQGGGGGMAQAMLNASNQPSLDPKSSKETTLEQRLRREELAEEEQRYGADPSPGTLRLLVENVKGLVDHKLQLATLTSVKESMKLVFECRTMLDKLLKDIPSHGNVVDVDGRNRAGTALPQVPAKRHMTNALQLKELFAEMKQQPVHIPQSRYGIDAETGKAVAVLVPKPPETGPQTTPPVTSVPSRVGDYITNREQQGTSPLLHHSQRSDGHDSQAGDEAPSSSAFPLPAITDAPSTAVGGRRVAPGSVSAPLPPPWKDEQVLLRYLRRQTQSVECACQTEETMARMVPEAEHKYTLNRVSQLEVLKGEYESIIGRLRTQLDQNRAALKNRTRIVAELRETLYRDTCLLRAQLNQLQMRNAIRSDGTVDTSTGTDLSRFHTQLDTVLLAVERNKVIGPGGKPEQTPEDQMRVMRAQAHEREVKLRRQLQDTKRMCDLVVAKKRQEVRQIRLANDVGKLRGVVLENIGQMKADLSVLRQDAKNLLQNTQTFMHNIRQELEYGIRRTALEVSNFKQLRGNQRALQDVLGVLDELFTPVMKPEYATGSHPWSYARHNEPLTFYVQQNHSEETAEAIAPELRFLQRHYSQLQRFSLYMHQQPDLHSPFYGRVMVFLGYRLLAAPECTADLIPPIRNAIERDRYLAGRRARINLMFKYLSFRKARVEQIAAEALTSFGYDLEVQPILSSPVRRRIDEAIARVKEQKAEVEENRLQNAKALYGLWRTSGIDVWEGKRAPVTRNPEAVWVPAPPMSKARRTARLTKPSMSASAANATAFMQNSTRPPQSPR